MHFKEPVIDDQNPFYCPTLTAVAFLETLRRQIRADPPPYSRSPEEYPPSFAERLDQSVDEADLHYLLYRPLPGTRDSSDGSSVLHGSFSLPAYDHSTPAPARAAGTAKPPKVKVKRRRSASSDTFSGLLAPPKRERSSQSVNDGSFELSAKADRLRYFRAATDALYSPHNYAGARGVHEMDGPLTKAELERRICLLEETFLWGLRQVDELYGPPIGTESPRGINVFISRLEALLPGIRLKERLYALDTLTHQRIADVLAIDGHLNVRILDMLRMSEIECLDLTASLMDEEGLNLGARELLHVLEKPNSFWFLSELSLSGASLQDIDIVCIHHLPRLSRLWVSNTGIGNEAIFHLVALKRTLAELDLALNPRIDDDAIPALLALPKLHFLSIFDTSVRMPGLRRLAVTLRQRDTSKGFEIEVPRECEEYLDSMHRKYMLYPQAPLIVEPEACAQLSVAALHRNLAAHAEFNSEILVGGSQAEMEERLQQILTVREMDLAVRDIVWQQADNAKAPHEKSNTDSVEVF